MTPPGTFCGKWLARKFYTNVETKWPDLTHSIFILLTAQQRRHEGRRKRRTGYIYRIDIVKFWVGGVYEYSEISNTDSNILVFDYSNESNSVCSKLFETNRIRPQIFEYISNNCREVWIRPAVFLFHEFSKNRDHTCRITMLPRSVCSGWSVQLHGAVNSRGGVRNPHTWPLRLDDAAGPRKVQQIQP